MFVDMAGNATDQYHTGVLQRQVRVPQPRAHGTYTRPQHLAHHLAEPVGCVDFNIVVYQSDNFAASLLHCSIIQSRIIKGVVIANHPNLRLIPLQMGQRFQIIQRFRRVGAVINNPYFIVGVAGFRQDAVNALAQQFGVVFGRNDQTHQRWRCG